MAPGSVTDVDQVERRGVRVAVHDVVEGLKNALHFSLAELRVARREHLRRGWALAPSLPVLPKRHSGRIDVQVAYDARSVDKRPEEYYGAEQVTLAHKLPNTEREIDALRNGLGDCPLKGSEFTRPREGRPPSRCLPRPD